MGDVSRRSLHLCPVSAFNTCKPFNQCSAGFLHNVPAEHVQFVPHSGAKGLVHRALGVSFILSH